MIHNFSFRLKTVVDCFRISKRYENASGAKVNKNKTFVLYTGAWKNKVPEFNEIRWTNTNVKTLGTHHGYEIDNAAIWLEKLKKMKNLYPGLEKQRSNI